MRRAIYAWANLRAARAWRACILHERDAALVERVYGACPDSRSARRAANRWARVAAVFDAVADAAEETET